MDALEEEGTEMSWQPYAFRAVTGRPAHSLAGEGSAGIGHPLVATAPPPHVVLGEGIAYLSAQIVELQREVAELRRALGRTGA